MHIPGFVDLQINGSCGVDFSSPSMSKEDFLYAAECIVSDGTAVFLPTLVTSPLSVYRRNLALISRCCRQAGLVGRIPGFHLEGPFLSPAEGARGVHNPKWIRSPDVEMLKTLYDCADGKIRLLTVAADRNGIETLISWASDHGITVSLGHHMAEEEHLERAVLAGARALTHLGNGVPQLLPRHKNPIWAGLSCEPLSAMIITDGHHLPNSLIKTFLMVKGEKNIIVTSDASPLAGLKPGTYTSMGQRVILEESGRILDPEKECLAGSSLLIRSCMNHLWTHGLLDYDGLLRVGFSNPLRLVGIDPDSVPVEPLIEVDRKNCRIQARKRV
jgi:N-acetylglucosamine-6-phosphate deacetylase